MEEGFWLSFDLISRVLVNQPIVSICLASQSMDFDMWSLNFS